MRWLGWLVVAALLVVGCAGQGLGECRYTMDPGECRSDREG